MSKKNIADENEISQIYTFNLGGYSQKVLIEGKSKELPVVITLHGGPGTPIPFSVGCRGMFPMFTDNFIMVYWDQLGCGINNYKIDDSFEIKTFVTMTCDLLSEVRKLFPNNKIYIFSTSWGSVLSALVSKSKPDEISGVVVCGQIIGDIFFNDEVVKTLENSNIPRKKLNVIKKANSENATSKELQLVSSCLMKYTDAYNNKNGKKSPMASMIMGLLKSPDYKFKDFKAVMVNGYRGNNSIWDELLKIDLTDTLSGINIPYVMLQGDTDIVASTQKVKDLVESSGNDNLKCYVVKDTGHLPGADMMNKVFEELKKNNRTKSGLREYDDLQLGELRMNKVAIAQETIRITKEKQYVVGEETVFLPEQDYAQVIVYSPKAGAALSFEKQDGAPMCTFSVTTEDSFQAAQHFDNPLVMNFANAHSPGGGFLFGAQAQEEALCRCSTLYVSLTSKEAKEMYLFNNTHLKAVESDYMLLSPTVCVFRDAKYNLLKTPFLAAVITLPAPNRRGAALFASNKTIDQTFFRRIRIMLCIAAANGYRSLVLGAWGCGEFGNKPEHVAEIFRQVLIDEQYGTAFDEVRFAIYGRPDGRNYLAFRDVFGMNV